MWTHLAAIFASALMAAAAPALAADPAGSPAAAPASVYVPVPRDVIYPGNPIRDEQLTDKAFARGVLQLPVHQDRDGITGRIARRILLPGRPVPYSALKEADLVVPGQPATLVYSSGGIEITGRSIALQGGKAGDVIACRNISSGIVVRGRIDADARVIVDVN